MSCLSVDFKCAFILILLISLTLSFFPFHLFLFFPFPCSARYPSSSQPKSRSPSLRHIRSARSQTLPGRFTNQSPQTLPDYRPRLTSDLTNSGNQGTNSNQQQQQQQQRSRRHTFSGNPLGPQTGPFKGVQDDIAIHEFQKAITVSDDEYGDYMREPSQPAPSDVVRGDYKAVEVDESTGGGLVSSDNPSKIALDFHFRYWQ